VKELKAFRKVWLKRGETTTVKFEIGFEQLAFYDINMRYAVEPGDFELMIGNSSRDTDLQRIRLQVTR
jgi:beta-glucosidase